jgi:TPR repeat protein
MIKMNNQENNELQRLYEAEMADQSAFARGRRALFDDDYEQAQQCFRQAVSEGHAEAMTFLGYMYRKGLGVRRDDAKAAVLYQQAIDTGGDTLLTSTAYNNLGVLYQKGEGVEQDLHKAKELFEQSITMDGSEDSKRHLQEITN